MAFELGDAKQQVQQALSPQDGSEPAPLEQLIAAVRVAISQYRQSPNRGHLVANEILAYYLDLIEQGKIVGEVPNLTVQVETEETEEEAEEEGITVASTGTIRKAYVDCKASKTDRLTALLTCFQAYLQDNSYFYIELLAPVFEELNIEPYAKPDTEAKEEFSALKKITTLRVPDRVILKILAARAAIHTDDPGKHRQLVRRYFHEYKLALEGYALLIPNADNSMMVSYLDIIESKQQDDDFISQTFGLFNRLAESKILPVKQKQALQRFLAKVIELNAMDLDDDDKSKYQQAMLIVFSKEAEQRNFKPLKYYLQPVEAYIKTNKVKYADSAKLKNIDLSYYDHCRKILFNDIGERYISTVKQHNFLSILQGDDWFAQAMAKFRLLTNEDDTRLPVNQKQALQNFFAKVDELDKMNLAAEDKAKYQYAMLDGFSRDVEYCNYVPLKYHIQPVVKYLVAQQLSTNKLNVSTLNSRAKYFEMLFRETGESTWMLKLSANWLTSWAVAFYKLFAGLVNRFRETTAMSVVASQWQVSLAMQEKVTKPVYPTVEIELDKSDGFAEQHPTESDDSGAASRSCSFSGDEEEIEVQVEERSDSEDNSVIPSDPDKAYRVSRGAFAALREYFQDPKAGQITRAKALLIALNEFKLADFDNPDKQQALFATVVEFYFYLRRSCSSRLTILLRPVVAEILGDAPEHEWYASEEHWHDFLNYQDTKEGGGIAAYCVSKCHGFFAKRKNSLALSLIKGMADSKLDKLSKTKDSSFSEKRMKAAVSINKFVEQLQQCDPSILVRLARAHLEPYLVAVETKVNALVETCDSESKEQAEGAKTEIIKVVEKIRQPTATDPRSEDQSSDLSEDIIKLLDSLIKQVKAGFASHSKEFESLLPTPDSCRHFVGQARVGNTRQLGVT
ncbi:MAG: hypothetical protein CMF50_07090 [Legionellales bacterium]|nr:hypothetical protein [Legionellales bacterium]|tara:strand:- start:14550 stop:17270 length:2721 start_codon:yes stop_codon:yes gene_type:complete